MPQTLDAVGTILQRAQAPQHLKADAWDAYHAATDEGDLAARLQAMPIARELKAQLWDLKVYEAQRAQNFPAEAPSGPQESAISRFATNLGDTLNPVTIIGGLVDVVRHPIQTAENVGRASADQLGKSAEAFREGRISEGIGHGAGAFPVIGPTAAAVGEQIASGDVAGGLGHATGLLAPMAVAPAVRATRAAVRTLPESVATAADAAASSRIADVISPKVGANKVRLGNRADDVAPALAKDLATDGAPLTREGFHAQVQTKLASAEQALDAASDARLAARTFPTQPMIAALRVKRAELTSQAVEGSRPMRAADGPAVRGARAPEEFATRGDISVDDVPPGQRGYRTTDTGEFAEPQLSAVPLGRDVVPGPNAARVAVIDRAIAELQQLGPVTRYDPIRTMRQAYDGPAKAVYSPAVTADYLKAQGGAFGAADVTGVLRETLARWDPTTATANAQYSLYRTANDVLRATAEVERTRPRVGRQIISRMTGTLLGSQAAGGPGAVVGYVGGPLIDAALASGMTTQLKTAAMLTRLASAIRAGNVGMVNSVTAQLKRLGGTVAIAQGQATSPSGFQTPATAPAR